MELFTVENLIALLALTSLEIVLGIDNIVVLSIIVAKLQERQQALARRLGLSLAMLGRIVLLLCISWIMHLTKPFFEILDHPVSGRDLILFAGGVFLIYKATYEIHHHIESPKLEEADVKKATSFWGAILQILALDIVFSLDSVITAVGIVDEVPVMITAIILAVVTMMMFARYIGDFIEKHPTFKMLALSFLLMIGVLLVVEGFGKHVDKAYIYFAMGFSMLVEFLNQKREYAVRTAG